jgi:hypothetical protein
MQLEFLDVAAATAGRMRAVAGVIVLAQEFRQTSFLSESRLYF